MNLQEAIAEITPSLIEMRRDFHRHPELGFQEVRTSAKLAEFLEGLGLEVTRGVAQTGVVARLRGANPGKPCWCGRTSTLCRYRKTPVWPTAPRPPVLCTLAATTAMRPLQPMWLLC